MATKKNMSKENFNGLMEGVRQMIDHMNGKKVPGIRVSFHAKPVGAEEVKKVRKSLGLTQDRFAAIVGEGLAAVQSWEQGARRPNGSASKLIRMLKSHPELAPELVRA
jgi:putative transcriptional regulator